MNCFSVGVSNSLTVAWKTTLAASDHTRTASNAPLDTAQEDVGEIVVSDEKFEQEPEVSPLLAHFDYLTEKL